MKELEAGFTFIVGNMFGAKTTELIPLLKAAERRFGANAVQAFKSPIDNRFGDGNDFIRSHDGAQYPAYNVVNTEELASRVKRGTKVIGIDELQFFDENIANYIKENMERYIFIATALQFDFRGEPFPLRDPLDKRRDSRVTVGDLIPYAKIVAKYSKCDQELTKRGGRLCGVDAIYTQRRKADGSFAPYEDPTVIIGGENQYAPRCSGHFVRPVPRSPDAVPIH